MKKHLYTLIISLGLLLTAASAKAQFNLGVRGSLNIANINEANFSTESITGFGVGAYARIGIPGSPIGIQPEILYTQKGFQSTSGLDEQQEDVTFMLDYIEIPLLARINLGDLGRFAPYFYGGTYLGLKINADAESGNFDVEVANLNSTDYGYTVGAGIDIGRLNIDARYEGGLTEIADNSNAKNGVITIAAGIELF